MQEPNSTRPEWQQRVLNERHELANKIQRLQNFLLVDEGGSSPEERRLLELQQVTMNSYLQCLDQRIESWRADKDRTKPVSEKAEDLDYDTFVSRLIKPGADILISLTPDKCNLWHLTSCLAPEVGELVQGLMHLDKKNAIEEAGDIEFYLSGVNSAVSPDEQFPPIVSERGALMSPQEHLLAALGDVFDEVKKHVIYEKDLDVSALKSAIADSESALIRHYQNWGVTRDEVKEANKNKLSKRYQTLYFTNEQAQDRADKKNVSLLYVDSETGIDPDCVPEIQESMKMVVNDHLKNFPMTETPKPQPKKKGGVTYAFPV
jgi:hypothetical protein